MEQSEKTLDMIVNLCKNRGYVFPGSEIYGGLANSWDYGPLGVEFKNNVKKAWLKKFVQESPYNVGLDAAIIMNPQTWVTTGHVSSFSDPLLDCRACKARHRADKLIGEEHPEVNVDAMSFDEMDAFIAEHEDIVCPVCGKHDFTPIRKFNLMFKTAIGVTEDSSSTCYLRPETAQGIFVNFANIQRTTRRKLPFGVCQVGKAFRNEITPGNFTFRTREFEQMELEFFCKPGTELEWFAYWKQFCHQWLLDLTNPKGQDFVFSVFDNTMKLSPNIDYIKWDANRHAENAGSEFLPKDRQSHFWIDYVQGFYKVMERIRAKYPDVLIQACASGGGRVEYGALKYFDEVWTSDNTEALSRARIQYGTSLFYPAVVMGSHVSATPNHQTGNITPIKFRFDMACAGRLGMELQPKQMTDSERQFARRAIASYKEYRDIVMQGDLYRIGTPYDKSGCYGLMYVSKDRKQAVLFTYSLQYQGRSLIPKFRLQGLDPKTGYTIRELNVDKSRNWFDGKTFSGEMLSNAGINPSMPKIYDSGVFLLTAE